MCKVYNADIDIWHVGEKRLGRATIKVQSKELEFLEISGLGLFREE